MVQDVEKDFVESSDHNSSQSDTPLDPSMKGDSHLHQPDRQRRLRQSQPQIADEEMPQLDSPAPNGAMADACDEPSCRQDP